MNITDMLKQERKQNYIKCSLKPQKSKKKEQKTKAEKQQQRIRVTKGKE